MVKIEVSNENLEFDIRICPVIRLGTPSNDGMDFGFSIF